MFALHVIKFIVVMILSVVAVCIMVYGMYTAGQESGIGGLTMILMVFAFCLTITINGRDYAIITDKQLGRIFRTFLGLGFMSYGMILS